MKLQAFLAAMLLSAASVIAQAQTFTFSEQGETLETVGRGHARVADGVLKTKDNYVVLGDKDLKDYAFSFRARNPEGAEQVQLWAGFRAANRYDRYVVGIKGGLIDQVYLLRLGYMGTDEFMGERPLRFHPVPGEWYRLRIEVVGQRIRVFVGDEQLPYIDVTDKNGTAASYGPVTLGGGWIETEYDDLTITPISPTTQPSSPDTEFARRMTPQQKEAKRQKERAAYQPIVVERLEGPRTDISLDGNWLFMPINTTTHHPSPTTADDADWHVMTVPAFWNPIRIWLHGETMGTPKGHQSKGVSDRYYQQESDRCENYTFDYTRVRAAWYRQWVQLPDEVAGKQLTLHFDAVSKVAEVYVNGHRAGSHVGMFADFSFDVSDWMKPGRNLIEVKVTRNTADDTQAKNSQLDAHYALAQGNAVRDDGEVNVTKNLLRDLPHGFYGNDPAGIWQPVRLTVTERVRIEDVFIRPSLTGATFEVTLKNYSSTKTKVGLNTSISEKGKADDGQGLLVAHRSLSTPDLSTPLAPGEERTVTYTIDGLQPKLWTPQHPHLYDFGFELTARKKVVDDYHVTSGFRTFEVKDGFFYLNGVKYWLRGANQVPSAICPDDEKLAHRFFQLMKEGHIEVTRMHTAPFNETWMQAADEDGIGVSFEGTWPWLMLENRPIPDQELLQLWGTEMLQLMKKYRNHPSLLLWTVNNEMKFYDLDTDKERAKQKMTVISDLVKKMRQMDSTRPMVYDSNYFRKGKEQKYGTEFMQTIDDGDVDDVHAYYNWYDYSLFRFFNGEFEKWFLTPGRPLISQEMSTGYPNNETGHPTRSYQIIHQNPLTLVGYKGYDFANPRYFLETQAFTTGELAEALRRTSPNAAGILHFSLHTWFQRTYDADHIKPWPTYYALSRALQPVLVSAEIWGRNLYGGAPLTSRICVVNDREDGSALPATTLFWRIVDEKGITLRQGQQPVRPVAHYEHYWLTPQISMPEVQTKRKLKLLLSLRDGQKELSNNEYALTVAPKQTTTHQPSPIALIGNGTALDFLGVKTDPIDWKKLSRHQLIVLSGVKELTDKQCTALLNYQEKGGRLLLLDSKEAARQLFPQYVKEWILPTEGDICYMENEDDPVFDGIDCMELRYWNNNQREMPRVCNATLKTVRSPQVDELAGQMKIHAYIDGGKPEDRIRRIEQMRGFTLVRIHHGKGTALVSTLCTDKAPTDPIAAQLLLNMLNDK